MRFMALSEGYPYDKQSIATSAPAKAGVYGLYRRTAWIYWGETTNIRDRLTQHLDTVCIGSRGQLRRGQAPSLDAVKCRKRFCAWQIAKASGTRGTDLMRPLLLIQFLLITCLLVFSVITKPSAEPHGLMATMKMSWNAERKPTLPT